MSREFGRSYLTVTGSELDTLLVPLVTLLVPLVTLPEPSVDPEVPLVPEEPVEPLPDEAWALLMPTTAGTT